jgi:hypothetical protein
MTPAIADHRLHRLAAGTMDVENRYGAALMLTADAETRVASCSGVLLNPRVALTAASCVCWPGRTDLDRPPEKRIWDASTCAERTFLRTVRYGAAQDPEYKETSTSKTFRNLQGRVRAHPDFKLVLDDRGAVLTSHADLALIVLDSVLEDRLPFVALAESEVQADETLIMAGFADDMRFGGFAGIRYFRKNKVTQVTAEAGRILYEQQGPFLYDGYTGGPCFREDKNHPWLVGIASVGSDRELSFTSTYFFREWLRAELRHAAPALGERP